MIIKFKLFENNNKLYSFIIANSDYTYEDFKNFFINNIGEIIVFDENANLYLAQYLNMPNILIRKNHDSDCWWFRPDEILYESKNKEDLEIILNSKKYNL